MQSAKSRSAAPHSASSRTKRKSRSRVADEDKLCQFTFADGRQCRMFRCPAHPQLCLFHAREELQLREYEKISAQLASISGGFRTHTDINHVIGNLFKLVAAGFISPARARSLTQIAQLLLQSQKNIRWETNLAYNFDWRAWDNTVRAAYPHAPRPAVNNRPAANTRPPVNVPPAQPPSAQPSPTQPAPAQTPPANQPSAPQPASSAPSSATPGATPQRETETQPQQASITPAEPPREASDPESQRSASAKPSEQAPLHSYARDHILRRKFPARHQ